MKRQIGSVGLFVHDSVFTEPNTGRELRLVAPLLAPRSIVLVNHVAASGAFARWVAEAQPDFYAVVRAFGKADLIGIAAFARGVEGGG
jgi:hypothetical protein